MKNFKSLFFLIIVLTTSCNPDLNMDSMLKKNDRDALFQNVFNDNNIESQFFTINNNIDNIIKGKDGIRFRIPKNTFVDSTGATIEGEIKIELKEALKSINMVLGNLTTTFEGKPLQSGGMFFLNATFNGKDLGLGDGKSILTSVPNDTLYTDMSVFEGSRDSLNAINWTNPFAINFQPVADTSVSEIDVFEKTHNIKYWVEGFTEALEFPKEVNDEVSRIAWEGAGLKIRKDSSFNVGEYTVHFYKQEELTKWSQVFTAKKGENTYITDKNIYYIFKLKNLGWANIDRLYSDPRTEEVDLIAKVLNESDFNFVYTTMVTQSMYLPGYQKKDDSFSFTHGDYESTKLPIGEKATIIATAIKGNKTYFGFQTINIQKKQEVKFELELSSKENIKEILISEF